MSNFEIKQLKILKAGYARFRTQLPMIVSTIAANTFKENFRRQGYEADSGGINRWKKRVVVDAGRGILTKSGRLRRSLRAAPTGNEARVVTNVPYAKVHNEGFKGTVSVKSHKRYTYQTSIQKRRTKSGKKRNTVVKTRNGVTRVKGYTKRMTVVARPFMITTKPLLNRINHQIDLRIQNLFK
jgi:phage gpG-like protein